MRHMGTWTESQEHARRQAQHMEHSEVGVGRGGKGGS